MVRTLLEISAFPSPSETFCPHILTRHVRRLSPAPGCPATLRHRSVTTDALPPMRHHISYSTLVPWQIRHGARHKSTPSMRPLQHMTGHLRASSDLTSASACRSFRADFLVDLTVAYLDSRHWEQVTVPCILLREFAQHIFWY